MSLIIDDPTPDTDLAKDVNEGLNEFKPLPNPTENLIGGNGPRPQADDTSDI